MICQLWLAPGQEKLGRGNRMEETKPWVWVCQFEEPGLHPPIGQCPADQSVAVRQRNLALWPSICQDSTDLHVGPSSGGGRYFGMGGGT